MNKPIEKSQFVLAPYMESSNRRGAWQLVNTLVPYLALWIAALKAGPVSLWLLPPIVLAMVLFSCRCFSLMHDCGHFSLFRSKWMNQVAGFVLGVINGIPQYPWSRGHAFHHRTNGDWERYGGPVAVISTREFSRLSAGAQRRYELLRHPLMLLPGGFFYLIIKPRLNLVLGLCGLTRHAFRTWRSGARPGLGALFSSYKSANWYTTGEFWHLLSNNVIIIGGWVVIGQFVDFALFFAIYSITLTLSAAICICVFFVQHNFEGSYAHTTEGWDKLQGALDGTSYLEMPRILRWFAADIGYHNIHHLSERIPNYRLAACHRRNLHLLADSKRLVIADIPGCWKYILWDERTDRAVSIAAFWRHHSTFEVAGPAQEAARP